MICSIRDMTWEKSSDTFFKSANILHSETSKNTHSPDFVYGVSNSLSTYIPSLPTQSCFIHFLLLVWSKYSHASCHSNSGSENNLSRPCFVLSFQNSLFIGADTQQFG